jgi:hypothetical protein
LRFGFAERPSLSPVLAEHIDSPDLRAEAPYVTRIGGYLLLRGRTLGARGTAIMEAAPGCVLKRSRNSQIVDEYIRHSYRLISSR